MNKQIEDMAKILCVDYGNCEQCICKSIESIGDGCTTKLDCERLYNAGYRKASDVLGEVLNILSDLKEDYLADEDVREACAISYAEIKIAELKKKYESANTFCDQDCALCPLGKQSLVKDYESEGADDEFN